MDVARFAYGRAIAPMMWVLVALSGIELLVLHLLVAHWSPAAAIVLSILTAGGITWLVVAIRSFSARPVEVDADGVLMQVGIIRRLRLPANAIAAARTDVRSGEPNERGVLNMALIAYPNVLVDLVTPIPVGRRHVRAVAHRLDDPAAFVATVDALLARR